MVRELQIGDPAPDFDLPIAYSGRVRLSELVKERTVILAFYPSDFGIICSVEMKQLKAIYDDLVQAGAEVLGVSTNSQFVHSAWREHLDLPFPLVADFDGKMSDSYGALAHEYYMFGRSKRALFIVDRRRTVRYTWVSEDPSLEPDYDEVLQICRDLNQEHSSPASPVPAGSTP